MNWNITFITEEDFQENIRNTIIKYYKNNNLIDLDKFNSNIIDPIKLLFDMKVYNKSFEDMINDEVKRQVDRSNSNEIGYFHQNMFKYIDNCIVPEHGFDVIYIKDDAKIFIELKNKHNTMNSDSSNNIYTKMVNKLKEEPNCKCYLVEVIAKKSQNIVWSVNNTYDERIRRVSIDKLYEEITGIKDAFKMLCDMLPYELDIVANTLTNENVDNNVKDNILNELKTQDVDFIKSMFMLAFNSYNGFNQK